MIKDSLGDRMKGYEVATDPEPLAIGEPIVVRVDGKAFHSLVRRRNLDRPHDLRMHDAMTSVLLVLCQQIQGACFGYQQSDEVSILAMDGQRPGSQTWFGGKIQKIASVSAAIATGAFRSSCRFHYLDDEGLFDARVFNVPKEDVDNYFIWRQLDAERNAVSAAARAVFSHQELQGKNCHQMTAMLAEAGRPIDVEPLWFQRGTAAYKEELEVSDPDSPCGPVSRATWVADLTPPRFLNDRQYVLSRMPVPEVEVDLG